MFKKMLVIMMVLGLVFAGSAMAGVEFGDPGWYQRTKTQGGIEYQYFPNGHPLANSEWSYCGECNFPVPNGASVSGYYDGQALEWASDYDHSGTNDFAFAQSGTMIGGTMSTFADAVGSSVEYDYEYVGRGKGDYICIGGFCWESKWGSYDRIGTEVPNEASQEGNMLFVAYDGNVHACSFDIGLFSHSFAKAELGNVFYLVNGSAEGVGGLNESVELTIRYGGNLFQETLAEESGYGAGYVIAQEQSGLSFLAFMPTIYDNGVDEAGIFRTNLGYSPFDAVVKGASTVEIDPYGNTRSIYANTWNEASLSVNQCFQPQSMNSMVQGSGIVEGMISKGGSFAYGNAQFMYFGSMNGQGSATLDAVVKDKMNSSSVIINGSSSAVADGFVINNNVPQ